MKTFTTLLVIGMFATAVAMADDVDDVRAAVQMQSFVAALNAGDAGALTRLHATANTNFGARGGLLETYNSPEERRQAFQATRVKFNVQARHIDVRIYGSSTAVATNYGMGRITRPDGTTGQVNNRITAVLIKQGGQWKIVHQHLSPMVLPQ